MGRDASYLLLRQRDGNFLKRVALEEFITARNSDRMVAFVGSRTSEHLSYPDWNGLVDNFLADCPLSDRRLLKELKARAPRKDARFAALDIMDLAELLANRDRHADETDFKEGRRKFANESFSLRGRVKDAHARPRIGAALFRSLGIKRAVTLNYDLELEWEVFLTEAERRAGRNFDRTELWKQKVSDLSTEKALIERHVPALGNVVSDVLDRDDSAQLIEFAIGPPDDRYRILHLHGRYDVPMSMLVTRRDYRNRYWQSGFSKLPFEYGLRLIFTGNPVLFIGIGMSEGEVTQALEQLLSDNPNRRAAPVFLLWNSSSDRDSDEASRLLFNRKFGVHVLFDREIAEHLDISRYDRALHAPFAPPPGDKLDPLSPKQLETARRLEQPLIELARIADQKRAHHFWKLSDFRTPQAKYLNPSCRTNVWEHDSGTAPLHQIHPKPPAFPTPADAADHARKALVDALRGGSPIKAIIGESGSRRGAIASALGAAYDQEYSFSASGRVVLINGAFVTETDSVFGILSGAWNQRTAQHEGTSRTDATMELIRLIEGYYEQAIEAAKSGQLLPRLPRSFELTLIINSMERFIAHDGSSLSTEMDAVIRVVTNLYVKIQERIDSIAWGDPAIDRIKEALMESFPIRLILIGTPRLKRYLSVIAPDQLVNDPRPWPAPPPSHQSIALRRVADREETQFTIGEKVFAIKQDCYFRLLAKSLLPAGSYSKTQPKRREFLAKLFDQALLSGRRFTQPELAFQILRVLAFIGQPTEQHVLYHAPSLWNEDGSKIDVGRKRQIDAAVRELVAAHLILEINPFPSNKGARLGLHKAVTAEIRQRYGIPVSDARLASGFNIGLYTAHPLDSFTPDQRWHREIGKMVDFLIGRYRDAVGTRRDILNAARAALPKVHADPTVPLHLKKLTPAQLARLADPEMTDCLRAALSLMRSYYSTPALLMYCNRDIDPWNRDGPLTEHAERLLRLIRVSKEVTTIRRFIAHELRRAGKADQATVGTPPFYPDDLVWLNNELGVVRITQGNLFEAREALEEALRLNQEFVDFHKRYLNWRRISLNLVQVEIDSGAIEAAEDRLRDIESALEDVARLFGDLPRQRYTPVTEANHLTFQDYVIAHYAHGPCSTRTTRVDRWYPTDMLLTVGLVLGHRALCQHLRGALEPARESFRDSIAILERLNEQRAYAFFQRHSAALHFASNQVEESQQALRLCVAAAGPSRQTDIDHAGRIALSHFGILIPTEEREKMRAKVIPQLVETLRYATTSDMYRLQLEAMHNMALVHLRNGDADSAMQFATDALAIATRCGFGLRQVSLRISLGRILAFRHDRESAKQLLRLASQIAASLHYERAVQTAEDALVELA